MDTAATFLADLDRRAILTRVHCASGVMVWRAWGEGSPVVLLHGGSGSWRHWARNVSSLAATHRVLVPDLPGMGDSDLPPEPVTRASAAGMVLEALESLTGDAFDLVGFSYGGSVAGVAAGLAPERLRSLTLVGPGGFGKPIVSPPLVGIRDLQDAEREAAHRTNLERLMFANPARIDALALEIQEQNTRRVHPPRSNDWDQPIMPGVIEPFRGPCNAVWGEHDNLAAGDRERRVASLLACRPDADIQIVPDAGHWVAYERAAAFNRYLQERLAPLSGAAIET